MKVSAMLYKCTYCVFTFYGRNAYLCPVKLSQKVTKPSVANVMTQLCAAPLALVPTHTKAFKPKPSKRLHKSTAWSSQS